MGLRAFVAVPLDIRTWTRYLRECVFEFIAVQDGLNKSLGVATLVGGTVTVANTRVLNDSRIFLSGQNSSGASGGLTVSARVEGVSFTVTSTSGSDTRDVAWWIVEPS
jgi:hypothetical protein